MLFKPFVGNSLNESLITLFFNYALDIICESDLKAIYVGLLFLEGGMK